MLFCIEAFSPFANMRLPVFFLFGVICASSAQTPRVQVDGGFLVGETITFSENEFINVTKKLDVFLGVPFANPPERFEPPEPRAAWDGDWDATSFSQPCVQGPGSNYGTGDEDCLYLNVFVPNPVPPSAAVMVWIHGGAFYAGTAMSYAYWGAPLVAVGDVIMVSINYRLGIFAQLSTGDDAATGGYGMLDQVEALKWVHTNIHAFGGDPDKITIFGESAGAASVNFHLLSDMSRNYFQQAIMESGSAMAFWAFEDLPEKNRGQAMELGGMFDCDVTDTENLVTCLKSVDPHELQEKADKLYVSYPVVKDGAFMTDSPANIYAQNRFKRATLLVGFNEDEGTFDLGFLFPDYLGQDAPPPINRTEFEAFVKFKNSWYGVGDEVLIDSTLHQYTDWSTSDYENAMYFDSSVNYAGDIDFKCPADMVLRAHAEAGDQVYKYYMTHAPTKGFYQYRDIIPEPTPWMGAGHTEELVFVFGMPFIDELNENATYDLQDTEKELSVNVMTFWTNFAKTGDPNRPDSTHTTLASASWPLFSVPELFHQEISLDLGDGRAERATKCHYWNSYMPTLKTFIDDMDGDLKEWKEDYLSWKDDMDEWDAAFAEYQKLDTCG